MENHLSLGPNSSYEPSRCDEGFLFPSAETDMMLTRMIEPPLARDDGSIRMSRWSDNQVFDRRSIIDTPQQSFTVLIAVRPVEVEISCSEETLLNGAMPSGSCYVGVPGRAATLTFRSSFDFICLVVANRFLQENGIAIDFGSEKATIFRDPVIETLLRALVHEGNRCGAFRLGLVQALAARSLNRVEAEDRGTPLPKWRLAKFERFIASRLHDMVSLEEMADAVSLSRMHFAKSFRLATGFTPHEYLLFRRIEWAKNAMLTSKMNLREIALEAGFQAQAHFTTVFKRFTGTSPAQWKLDNLRSA